MLSILSNGEMLFYILTFKLMAVLPKGKSEFFVNADGFLYVLIQISMGLPFCILRCQR